MSDNSDLDKSFESENLEEYKERMLNYLKTKEDYFLTVNQDILMKVRGLTKTYGKKEVVNLTFGFEPGICLGMIGPNGAGKTTTIKLLLSVIRKNGGEIIIKKKNERNTFLNSSLINQYKNEDEEMGQQKKIEKKSETTDSFWNEKCGICFQEESLWNELTVEQHVEFMCKLFNIQDFSKVINLLKYFEINHLLDREVYKLSSGERKKLLVVLNLINKSKYYF